MTDWGRVWRLSRAMIDVEVEARNRWLVIYPVGFGLLFVALAAIAATQPESLTGTTQGSLEDALDRYFTSVSGPRFAVALVVIQAPVLVSVFAAVVAVPTARSLAGRRASSGEFESLLAAPYTHGEVFASLVATSFVLALIQTLVLGVIGVGGAWGVLLAVGATFTLAVGPVVYAPYFVPVSVALWAALVATVVYLAYPETAMSGTGTGNALMLVAFVPAFALLGLTTVAPGVSPLLVAVGGFVGVGVLTAIGAAAVGKWFRPARVL
ncbi:MAG TPA: hypothetical protein VJ898_14775 [Natrialbaceae archaeon]|nr:hypothetical protein [Natrialbaceae archaeon]